MQALQVSHYHRSLVLLALITGLLVGCASDPPQVTTGYSTHKPSKHTRKKAYNRPYRVNGKMYYPLVSAAGYSEIGIASWYGAESGNRTSMGMVFHPDDISAAHKTLPLPSKVRVTNLHNGRSVIVTVNDRGPFKSGRLIDLSRGAARKIGMQGLAKVKVEYVGGVGP